MCTVYKSNSDSNQKKKDPPSQSIGDEDFYVLKFPHKLWRIVNECNTGAIQWGIYGKTILIDYNLFQAQYLECEVPKFKTRNMTSFVRQLNMYGFKKMQTQVKNDSSRCCNIHEFFHNSFRFGRNDLLDSVKRRPTPVKNSKVVQNLEYQNQSRVQMCRATFAKVLQESRDRCHQGNRKSIDGQDNIDEIGMKTNPEYNFQVIPVENSFKTATNESENQVTIEVSSDFQDLIDMNQDGGELENETENSSNEGETTFENEDLELAPAVQTITNEEPLAQYHDRASSEIVNNYFLDVSGTNSQGGNHSVQVKKGFDGSNYVIDLMVGCPDEGNMENVVTKVLESELYNGQTTQEDLTGSECMIIINSSLEENQIDLDMGNKEIADLGSVDEFYDSISKNFFGL